MSTTHYSPSTSALDTETYVRGKTDERGVAIACDVPGGPGAFAARARALTQNTKREVQCLHYRQSFADTEFDPNNLEDVQRVNDLGYRLAKKMHPHADCLVVTHTDGRGGKAHNHVLLINHNNRTGKALSDYRSFHDRPEMGGQHGVQSANDDLMREYGLTVATTPEHSPKDWELRREDFAEGSLDREMGDRMDAALDDPRAVNKEALLAVIADQNRQVGVDGERVPQMRLHTSVAKKGTRAGQETWTLYIEDRRGEGKRAERRKRTSALSTDFTAEGAQEIFAYHQDQKEKRHEREARQVEAAGTGTVVLDDVESVGEYERRGHRRGEQADEGRERSEDVSADRDRGDGQAGTQGPAVDLAALRQHVAEDRRRREQARRDRDDAARAQHLDRRAADHRGGVVADFVGDPDREDDGLAL